MPHSKLARLLAPPVFPDDEARSNTAAILNSLVWNLGAALVLSAVFGLPFVFANPAGSACVLALLGAEMLATRSLMFRGRVAEAGAVLVSGLWLTFAATTVLSGGIYSVNLTMLLAVSVVAGLLFGTRWAVAVAGLTSLLAMGLALLELSGHPPPQVFSTPPISRWGELTLSLVLALIPLSMSLRNLAGALARVRRELRVRLDAEAALRQSEERFRAIYDSVGEAVFLHDPATGVIVDVNAKATEMYGWTREGMRELPVARICSGEPGFTEAEAHEWLVRAGRGETAAFEWHARRSDGTLFWIEMSLRRAEIGGRSLILGTVRDIDERIRARAERARLEEQLRQSQKLESIGRLAGGVAHDFNNLLTAILGNLELALLEVPESGETMRSHLGDARQAAESAADLTKQLLAFSRKQVIEPKVLDPVELLRGLQKLLARLLGEDVELATVCPPGVGLVRADRSQLEHVVVNLAVNARDAMPAGGRLTLGLANVEVAAGHRPDVAPGSYVRLSVSDTGTGMTPEILAKVFEPFFTTKPRGKGTGLGLAMAFGTISQHGGFIEVRSAPGEGSTFELHLPRAAAQELVSPQQPAAAQLPRGAETILLVEDEPFVREVGRRTLRKLGYLVRDFGSAEEALEALASLGPVDLLLTDVILPGMNGIALAERCRLERPGLPALFTSGYADDVVAPHGLAQEGLRFLAKPFRPQTLAAKVREVLDEAGTKAAGGG